MDEGPRRSSSATLIVETAKGGLNLDHLVEECESNSEAFDFRAASELLPFEGWGVPTGVSYDVAQAGALVGQRLITKPPG